MKILIGFEESQTIMIAFRKKGHESYSCDIQDCSGGFPEYHLKMDILELFAGVRSLGNEADKMGHTVFSVDWTKYDKIDLAIDIEELTKEQVPFTPDVVWASPDCATYSIAGIRFHRINTIEPISDYAKKCDKVNVHFIELIKEWLKINPNMVFFIENPRGMLRKMPFMQEFKRHTVWYCQYGDNRAKPTDIWTNSKDWQPRPVCRNYKYDENGNIIDKHCHHDSARRGNKTGTQGKENAHERSKIPSELCIEILNSFEKTKAGGHSTNFNINCKLSARLHKHAVSRSCGLVAQNLKLW